MCVVTYNQERYIRECLQSIIDQETNFDFEVIVGDDCSTDGTRDIVQEFAKNYPDIVKPIFHKQNIGFTENILTVYRTALGEYISHIDGDDFMLPGKLRIQAEELDRNQECTICFHAVRRYDQPNNRYLLYKSKTIPRKSDIYFLLLNISSFTHSSKMFRATSHNDFNIAKEIIIDASFHVHHALTGKILYLNDVLGVYRVNVGISAKKDKGSQKFANNTSHSKLLRLTIEAAEYAEKAGIDSAVVGRSKATILMNYAYNSLLAKNYSDFKYYMRKSNDTAFVDKNQMLLEVLSCMPRVLYLLLQARLKVRIIFHYLGVYELIK